MKTDTKQYEFDPQKAKDMLDAAGWAEGSDGIREKDVKAMQKSWSEYCFRRCKFEIDCYKNLQLF